MKEMLNHATQEQPLLISLDSVDQLVSKSVIRFLKHMQTHFIEYTTAVARIVAIYDNIDSALG